MLFLSNLGVLEANSATLRWERGTPWLPAYRMITQRDGQPFILTISPTANLDSPVTRCMSSDCWSKRTQTGKKQSKTFFFFFNNNFTNSWFTSFPRISWRAYNSLLLFLFYSKEKCVFFCRTVFRHCWLLRVKTENQTSAVVRSVIPLWGKEGVMKQFKRCRCYKTLLVLNPKGGSFLRDQKKSEKKLRFPWPTPDLNKIDEFIYKYPE